MRDQWQCYRNVVAVTPSDTAVLGAPCLALWITGGGTVKFDTAGGQSGVQVTAASNAALPFQVTRVYATGTAATGIFALS